MPTTTRTTRLAVPLLAAAAALVVLVATLALRAWGPHRTDDVPQPAPTAGSSTPADPGQGSAPGVGVPVAVGMDLFVGGEQVEGRWWSAAGRGLRWLGLREDGTWWWGYDTEPQRIDGNVDQPPTISPSGGYLAYVVGAGRDWSLVGADTERGGEGFGALVLPHRRMDPPPRAVAVTDDGLVVAGGPDFQWLWRPLVDGSTVDLAETAPGQVIVASTDAGLIVNEGTYGQTDGATGAPYLARVSEDGTLTRLGPAPTHDLLEAGEQWLAYAPPGTLGGEVPGVSELRVQRLDGSDRGEISAPDGGLFSPSQLQWETAQELLVPVVSPDGDQALARCRPGPQACDLVDPAD